MTPQLQIADSEWAAFHIRQAIAECAPATHAPRILRHLAKEYPDLFFAIAAHELETKPDSPASDALTDVLLESQSLFERIANPARCTPERAATLFRRLIEADPTIDFRLARTLPGRGGSGNGAHLSTGHIARAIDTLDRTSPGQRLLPLIAHLTGHPDRAVAAKAALFVGRRTRNHAWVEKQLLNGDPRLRANAIEGSWGSKSQTAIRLMEASTSDENPRVVANAFIGLHAAGCAGIPQRVLNLSRSHAPGHRSAAAWVMGKLGHPEFIGPLTALVRDGNPQVRSTAVRALGQISRAEARRMAVEQAAVEICRVKEKMPPAAAPKAESEALNLPVPGFATRFDRKK